VADTAAVPAQLLALAHRIEAANGRTREVRWGPRTLDVDVLAVAGQISDDPALTLPHPRAAERAFVLVPWAQVDPGFVVPGTGETVAGLLAALPRAEVAQVRPLQAP
jgi:2-amino-4-hydroxy-6-hydroxymethyldihydropteridine diphosphokinase